MRRHATCWCLNCITKCRRKRSKIFLTIIKCHFHIESTLPNASAPSSSVTQPDLPTNIHCGLALPHKSCPTSAMHLAHIAKIGNQQNAFLIKFAIFQQASVILPPIQQGPIVNTTLIGQLAKLLNIGFEFGISRIPNTLTS